MIEITGFHSRTYYGRIRLERDQQELSALQVKDLIIDQLIEEENLDPFEDQLSIFIKWDSKGIVGSWEATRMLTFNH